jgi:hypothetical protein
MVISMGAASSPHTLSFRDCFTKKILFCLQQLNRHGSFASVKNVWSRVVEKTINFFARQFFDPGEPDVNLCCKIKNA